MAKNRPKARSRKWLPALLACLVVAAIVAGLWPRPVPVETALVATGKLQASVNEEGKTRIKQRFVISAPVAGQLRRIPYKAGAQVVAGETVLAVIDPLRPALLDLRARSLAEARRDTASANVEKARAASDFARTELQRFTKLFADGAVSVQEREAAQLRAQSGAKDLAAAESALRQAEAELLEFTAGGSGPARPPVEVKAPTSGVVLRVLEENARVVMPATPLVEIGDPSDLEVVIDVLSRDGAIITPGTRVEFHQWGGKEPLQGRVRLVEPAAFTKVSALGVEEQRVNVIVDFITPPEQRRNIGDNFRVEARIIVWESDSALKVPAGALFRQREDWAVFAIEGGRASLRKVIAGRSSGTETQILEGLKAGDRVILYPGAQVKNGTPVKPIEI